MVTRLSHKLTDTENILEYASFKSDSGSNSPTTVQKSLYPIIKLGEKMTYNPERCIDCPAVIVKAQHLVSKDGKSTTKMFHQIQDEGGIHNHLDFEGDVILSSIMPDRAIASLTSEMYAEIIDTTGVNFYITPDGETYLGETAHSAYEVFRILDQTKDLLKLCPTYTPIGLVKGCTTEQIRYHVTSLQTLGIETCYFHISDFFRGSHSIIDVGRRFAYIIRSIASELIIYGIGSRSHINALRFADGFATQSHYVKAFYGYKWEGTRWIKARRQIITRELIMHNLRAIRRFAGDLADQQGLNLQSTVEADSTWHVGTTEQTIEKFCI